jgi:thiol-disulfide isomerase/thioredoxin
MDSAIIILQNNLFQKIKFFITECLNKKLLMNLSLIAYNYLKACKIKISKDFLEQRIISHPYYPALISFTDTLDQLGLEYKAVEAEEKHIPQFSFPFLAHTPKAVGSFEIVPSIEYLENNRENFLNRWEGIAVMVKTPQAINNNDHEKFLKNEKKVTSNTKITIGIGLIILLLIQFLNFNWLLFIFSLLNIAGIAICSLIILHKLGKGNAITRQLCSTGKSHGCDLVLNSKASQIIKGVEFGDMGLIYFSAFLLFTLFTNSAQNANDAFTLLIVPCSLALGFTFFSFFYQWKIAKAWCRMCLITIGIVWLQSAILLIHFLKAKQIFLASPLVVISQFLLCFFLASLWLFIKVLIKGNQKEKRTETELLKWKRNPEVFQSLLYKQPHTNTLIPNNPVCLGNPNAPIQFTIVSNPFCRPCAATHQQLEDLYKRYPSLISINVNFLIKSATDREDRRTIAVEQIINAIDITDNKLQVLHDWFETMDIQKWKEKYPSINLNSNRLNVLRNYQHWLSQNNIFYTPFIYLNGYLLPKQYGLNDIESLIIELSESLSQPIVKKEQYEEVTDLSWQ